MEVSEIVALVGASVGALSGLWAWRKTRAESDSINVSTSIELVSTLRDEMVAMRKELDEQRQRRQELADELHKLQKQYEHEVASLRIRITTLESWIAARTGVDPSTIS